MTTCGRFAFALALAFFAFAIDAQAASTRVYLASNGANSGACTRTAPCLTFAYAFTQVLPKGEVVVLDTSSHPAITVTKSVTIVAAPGAYVVVSSTAAGSTAVKVTIADTDAVILRGLTVTGHGTATNGIWFMGAGTLQVEDCAVSGFTQHGIFQSATGKMYVKDTEVRNGQQYGIRMYVNSGIIRGAIDHCRVENITSSNVGSGQGVLIGNNANVTVSNTVSSGNRYGFHAAGSGRMSVSDSTAEGNELIGFYVTEGGYMAATHCRSGGNDNHGFAVSAGAMMIDSSMAANNRLDGIVATGISASAFVANTAVVGNGRYGLVQANSAGVLSRGNNFVSVNGTAKTSGVITYNTDPE